jgi:pSer/pThr/pTyr-binding forkhead associated (FHA) protein
LSAKRKDGNTDILQSRQPADVMRDRGPRPADDQGTPPWRLLLQIGSENRTTLGVSVSDEMLVGREDSRWSRRPEVDLAPFDGMTNGVSREHARILYDDATLYIEDLDSTNGTRINGFQLKPHLRYRLRDGDELEFGRLRAVLRFVRSSR